MYLLIDGTETTKEKIEAAYNEGLTRLVNSSGDGKTLTGLALDGIDVDTRNKCYSMWEEAWTTVPQNINSALRAAKA